MLEKEMYKKMKPIFNGAGIFLFRIENRTGLVPDVYFASRFGNGWIELKNIYKKNITKNEYITIPYRLGQLAWMTEHYQYNHNVFTVFTIDNTWYLFKRKPRKRIYLLRIREHRLDTLLDELIEQLIKNNRPAI